MMEQSEQPTDQLHPTWENRSMYCGRCYEKYADSNQLTVHEKEHVALKPYRCYLCGKEPKALFSDIQSCSSHGIEQHAQYAKLFACGLCLDSKKTYPDSKSLLRHLNLRHTIGEKLFMCHVCNDIFSDLKPFYKHSEKVHRLKEAEVKYTCGICTATFDSLTLFTDHQLARHGKFVGQEPFKCRYCDKAFWDTYSRNRHEFKHVDNTPYTCRYCFRKFSEESGLNMHLKKDNPRACRVYKKCLRDYPLDSEPPIKKPRLVTDSSPVSQASNPSTSIASTTEVSRRQHVESNRVVKVTISGKELPYLKLTGDNKAAASNPKSDRYLCKVCQNSYNFKEFQSHHHMFIVPAPVPSNVSLLGTSNLPKGAIKESTVVSNQDIGGNIPQNLDTSALGQLADAALSTKRDQPKQFEPKGKVSATESNADDPKEANSMTTSLLTKATKAKPNQPSLITMMNKNSEDSLITRSEPRQELQKTTEKMSEHTACETGALQSLVQISSSGKQSDQIEAKSNLEKSELIQPASQLSSTVQYQQKESKPLTLVEMLKSNVPKTSPKTSLPETAQRTLSSYNNPKNLTESSPSSKGTTVFNPQQKSLKLTKVTMKEMHGKNVKKLMVPGKSKPKQIQKVTITRKVGKHPAKKVSGKAVVKKQEAVKVDDILKSDCSSYLTAAQKTNIRDILQKHAVSEVYNAYILCSTCGAEFKNSQNFALHAPLHNKEVEPKPALMTEEQIVDLQHSAPSVDICERSQLKTCKLQGWVCTLCCMKFGSFSGIKTHAKSHAPENNPKVCSPIFVIDTCCTEAKFGDKNQNQPFGLEGNEQRNQATGSVISALKQANVPSKGLKMVIIGEKDWKDMQHSMPQNSDIAKIVQNADKSSKVLVKIPSIATSGNMQQDQRRLAETALQIANYSPPHCTISSDPGKQNNINVVVPLNSPQKSSPVKQLDSSAGSNKSKEQSDGDENTNNVSSCFVVQSSPMKQVKCDKETHSQVSAAADIIQQVGETSLKDNLKRIRSHLQKQKIDVTTHTVTTPGDHIKTTVPPSLFCKSSCDILNPTSDNISHLGEKMQVSTTPHCTASNESKIAESRKLLQGKNKEEGNVENSESVQEAQPVKSTVLANDEDSILEKFQQKRLKSSQADSNQMCDINETKSSEKRATPSKADVENILQKLKQSQLRKQDSYSKLKKNMFLENQAVSVAEKFPVALQAKDDDEPKSYKLRKRKSASTQSVSNSNIEMETMDEKQALPKPGKILHKESDQKTTRHSCSVHQEGTDTSGGNKSMETEIPPVADNEQIPDENAERKPRSSSSESGSTSTMQQRNPTETQQTPSLVNHESTPEGNDRRLLRRSSSEPRNTSVSKGKSPIESKQQTAKESIEKGKSLMAKMAELLEQKKLRNSDKKVENTVTTQQHKNSDDHEMLPVKDNGNMQERSLKNSDVALRNKSIEKKQTAVKVDDTVKQRNLRSSDTQTNDAHSLEQKKTKTSSKILSEQKLSEA